MVHSTESKSSLYETLCADLRGASIRHAGILAMVGYLPVRPGWLAVVLYRLSAACIHKGMFGKIAAKFFWRFNVFVNGCDISPLAVIGAGLIIHHPVGIVIGPVTIGQNVTILQNVTLGLRRASDDPDNPQNYPKIEDGVIIYSGAVVTGDIRIGANSSIGANAVVIGDVPPNSTVVGIPGRIVSKP